MGNSRFYSAGLKPMTKGREEVHAQLRSGESAVLQNEHFLLSLPWQSGGKQLTVIWA